MSVIEQQRQRAKERLEREEKEKELLKKAIEEKEKKDAEKLIQAERAETGRVRKKLPPTSPVFPVPSHLCPVSFPFTCLILLSIINYVCR